MPSQVTVYNMGVSEPAELYLCLSGTNICYYINQITSSQLPYTFQVPVPLDNLVYYCVKLVDNDGCELIDCFEIT
jgi:hypothetical protein